MRLEGRIAIVTGASRGIGFAIGRGLVREGARVVITGRDPVALERAASELSGEGAAAAVPADVRSAGAASEVVAFCEAQFGAPDILVNNAGTIVIKPTVELSEAEWDLVLDTNLKGTFLMCQAAGRRMLRAGRGSIINIGSIASVVGLPGRASYCASKGAMSLLTRSLATEWGPQGVRVNCLAPGYVRTEGHVRLAAQGYIDSDAMGRAAPARRVADVEEMVGPAVFLASDESSFVHGETLMVDGGWTSDAHAPGVG